MHESIRLLDQPLPELREPIMVVGFATTLGGETAAATVQYLVEAWQGRLLAEVDPDDFYDFTVQRPAVSTGPDGRRLEWPTVRLFAASPPGAERDVLLLVGPEPALRWRKFTEAITELMLDFGVRSLITLGSQAGNVPHTRPRAVQLLGQDGALTRASGIEPAATGYDGLADLATVLNLQLEGTAVETVRVNAMTPFYVQASWDPGAALALVQVVDRCVRSATSVAALLEQSQLADAQIAGAVAALPQLEKTVRWLEQQFDWISAAAGGTHHGAASFAAPPLDPDEVLADVQHLLREQRGGAIGH
jgi:hypothetical protein